jgi:hypothetical protein
MKALPLKLLFLAGVASVGVAQTNTFPTTGNVGIGTNPNAKLDILAGTKQEIATYTATAASGIFDFAVGGVGWVFSRPDDGSLTEAIYSYNSTGGAKNNLAISSRSDIVFTAGSSGPSGAPERVRFTDAGNVGIGTTNPTHKLDVNGDLALAATGHAYLYISGTTGDSEALWQTNGVNRWALGMNVGEGTENFNLYNYATGSTCLSVNKATGSVGIGTASPGAKLDVIGGAIRTDSNGYTSNNVGGTGTAAYCPGGIYTGGGTNWIYGHTLIGQAPSNGSGHEFFADGSAHLGMGGNVGIGTMNPTQKLSVNGTIRAKEVIVDTGWSDYVFAPNYVLAPLSEVEEHIKAHHTLPGVPSASEVADHGLSVGDMQAKLLAKIEELTLHQIEQAKDISVLKVENDSLRHEVETLKNFAVK